MPCWCRPRSNGSNLPISKPERDVAGPAREVAAGGARRVPRVVVAGGGAANRDPKIEVKRRSRRPNVAHPRQNKGVVDQSHVDLLPVPPLLEAEPRASKKPVRQDVGAVHRKVDLLPVPPRLEAEPRARKKQVRQDVVVPVVAANRVAAALPHQEVHLLLEDRRRVVVESFHCDDPLHPKDEQLQRQITVLQISNLVAVVEEEVAQ